MEESKFSTLLALIQVIERNKAMNNTAGNAMNEVYDEFANFLTDEQKTELIKLYNF